MLVKLYDRGPEGTICQGYEQCYEKDENSQYTVYHARVLRYCSCCGADLLGEWAYYDYENKNEIFLLLGNRSSCSTHSLEEYRNEITDMIQMTECPICNHELSYSRYDNLIPISVHEYERTRFRKYENLIGKEYLQLDNITYDDTDMPITLEGLGCHLSKEKFTAITNSYGTYSTYVKNIIVDHREAILDFEGYDDDNEVYCDLYLHFFDINNLDSILKFFRSGRKNESDQLAEKALETYINECQDAQGDRSNISKAQEIKSDPETLKSFITAVVNVENNIFSISQRLKSLYRLHIDSKADAKTSVKVVLYEHRKALEDLKLTYDTMSSIKIEDEIKLSDFPVNYPPMPKAPQSPSYPSKPTLPTYLKPNIFNKRKVLLINEELERRYKDNCDKYKSDCADLDNLFAAEKEKYDLEMAQYNLLVEKIKKQQQAEYEAAIQDAKNKLALKLSPIMSSLQDMEKNYSDLVENSASISTLEKAKNEMVESEIKQSEKLLKELFSLRNEMYESGVVFGKYCNIVALSSILEYLMSGRCVQLDGPEGAYNIFESEVRMNTVVSQLSQVIDSLEQIQKNQYIIYSTINETNKQLNVLNDAMYKALSSLDKIKSDTSNIKDYAREIKNNTEVSAYYSKVNAYYSKRNAELTNALGFMMAFR